MVVVSVAITFSTSKQGQEIISGFFQNMHKKVETMVSNANEASLEPLKAAEDEVDGTVIEEEVGMDSQKTINETNVKEETKE